MHVSRDLAMGQAKLSDAYPITSMTRDYQTREAQRQQHAGMRFSGHTPADPAKTRAKRTGARKAQKAARKAQRGKR